MNTTIMISSIQCDETFPSSAGGRLQFVHVNTSSDLLKPQNDSVINKSQHHRSRTQGNIIKVLAKASGSFIGSNEGTLTPFSKNSFKSFWGDKKKDSFQSQIKSPESCGILGYKRAANKLEDMHAIYEKDIDVPFGSSASSSIAVQSHRKQLRVKEKHSQKNHKKKESVLSHTQRRIRFGKPLDNSPDNSEYLLTMGMMVGLRVAVGRQDNPLSKKELTVPDFYQVDSYVFPPCGALGIMMTPPHKLGQTFKFKDYAPKVFKQIRECFGVDRMKYMLSVAGNYDFLDFITNAKSGEFFFFSHDENFMIKTMKKQETRFLRRILPHYYQHIRKHPDTLIVRLCGMYRVKVFFLFVNRSYYHDQLQKNNVQMHHIRRKVHFMVMKSVFDTPKEMHTIYDLKGSTDGRYMNENESVAKDLDLIRSQNKIHLGNQKQLFLEVIRKDVEFLSRMNVMDYSLLLGVHDRFRPHDALTSCRPHYTKFLNSAEGTHTEKQQIQTPSAVLECSTAVKRHWEPVVMNENMDEECSSSKSSDRHHSNHFGSHSSVSSTAHDNDKAPTAQLQLDVKAEMLTPMFHFQQIYRSSNASHCSTIPVQASVSKSCMDNMATLLDLQNYDERLLTEKRRRLARRDDLGVYSEMSGAGGSGRGRELYYMGIIDILQEYNMHKRAEAAFKTSFMRKEKGQISCISPKRYAERFYNFLKEHTD